MIDEPMTPSNGPPGQASENNLADRIAHAVKHAAHLLPAQGPIGVFIHHNTLHAFENLNFDEAVRRGGEVFGCEPYLSQDRFRDELGKGRIRFSDLRDILQQDLGESANLEVAPNTALLELRLAMLQYPLPSGAGDELRWYFEESDALRKVGSNVSAAGRTHLIADTRRWVMRDLRPWDGKPKESADWAPRLFDKFRSVRIEAWDEPTWEAFSLEALWAACLGKVARLSPIAANAKALPLVRHRDFLFAAGGVDVDLWVNDLLIRFCAAFLDQGVSNWLLPDRENGLMQSFISVYGRGDGPPDRWMHGVAAELSRLRESKKPAWQSLIDSLEQLGVEESEWTEYLSAELLALRGWAGMIHEAENRPDRFAFPAPEHSLVEYLAVRLILQRFAVAFAADAVLGARPELREFRARIKSRLPPPKKMDVESRALPVFLLAQSLNWTSHDLWHLSDDAWAGLVREIEAFDSIERRRVYHHAFERRFREQSLDALALHPRRVFTARPRFQLVTCIDEREESFRRLLEEAAPDVETFGTAGFFGVVMYFRGADDARYTPLCPVVVHPAHWVEERFGEAEERDALRSKRVRRALGRTSHQFHLGTRGLSVGAVISAGLGVLATIPLVARVLFPGLTAHFRRQIGGLVRAPKKTRLQLERIDAKPGPEGDQVGFSVDEMANIAERVLRDIGLTRNFARLVIILGHGSHSMNNPHESAHDCGACGGAVGGPNGRALAQILNDSRVRARLAERGIQVPADTVVVGGLHNTCNEYVKFADADLAPESHRKEFEEATVSIEEAIGRNAHERARRFESAPLDIHPSTARLHMDARAEDLAQVRPEWGHATNALCIVGRRERTRGLFLDRRAFLASYDATQDTPEAAVLTRTLQAVFPVCGGINLEYYFSHVDPVGYGAGTKLPHNITALLGVMDGAASDLRTGLPWQMVEIHEPIRLLIVCETTAEVMQGILTKHRPLYEMAAREWIQLAVLDPGSQRIQRYIGGEFVDYEPSSSRLPIAPSSIDWYRGWRDHLEFAQIVP